MTIFPLILIRTGGLPLGAWRPLACGIPDWSALQNAEHGSEEQLLKSFDDALFSLPDSPTRTAVYNARKDFYQRKKLPSPTFEANIQAELNCSQLLESLHFLQKTKQKNQDAEILFEQNLAANYKHLQICSKNDTLRRALLFASHDLLASLSSFADKPVDQFDKKDRRTAFSLLQYLTRAVFKTSPLGRFTTVQVRPIGPIDGAARNHPVNSPDGRSEQVGEWLGSKQLVTPNVALLPAIYEVLLREPAFFQSLRVVLNPCIAPLETLMSEGMGEWLYFDGEREAFQKIDPDPVADFVVNALLQNDRQLPFEGLVTLLENEVEATQAQLHSLVNQLIDIGLLEWQLPEKGISPGWCGVLYNYLGYLPSSPLLTEAAYLLHWLRTAARTLPFQTIEEAQKLQRETLQELKKFLEKHGGKMPPIPPEQIFFEDVAQDVALDLPSGVMEKLVGQLAECWQQKEFHAVPSFRARLYDFAEKTIPDGVSMDFLEFSHRFLAEAVPAVLTKGVLRLKPPVQPRHKGKIGALLQIFQENGEYKAVINAMYSGGGKLLARWLPLFPTGIAEQVKIWQHSASLPVASFPWHGWSNANFQPLISSVSVSVPDGRVTHSPGGRTILLGNIAVRKDEFGLLQLIEKQSSQPIVFNDLGLEAPETRPPVMQVLWHLGVPFVSSESLLPEGYGSELVGDVRHRQRVEFQSLVLARAAWELPQAVWEKLFSNGKSQAERVGLGIAALKTFGIPQRFFGKFMGRREKPQFFDMESPISMLLLEKNLRAGSGSLILTEMLPMPEQWLGERAAEFVVEFVAG